MVCYDIFDKEEKDLFEWNETVQKMIDWIEAHLTENPSLLEMSNQIGYSPYYCSNRFHEIVGMTFKSYVAGRRLVGLHWKFGIQRSVFWILQLNTDILRRKP